MTVGVRPRASGRRRRHGVLSSGRAVRPARDAALAGLHRGGGPDAGARDGGDDRDLLGDPRGPPLAAALRRARAPRDGLEPLEGLRQDVGRRRRGHGLPPARPEPGERGGLGVGRGEPDRRRRRRGARRDGRDHRQHVRDARRAAGRRARIHGRGRSSGRPARRGPELRPLAEPLRRRAGRSRRDARARRRGAADRRRDAARLRAADRLHRQRGRTLAGLDPGPVRPEGPVARKSRLLRGRDAAARQDGRAGERRAEGPGGQPHAPGRLSGGDAVRPVRGSRGQGHTRRRAAGARARLRRGPLPSPDGLRQRREPAARARGRTAARNLGARGDGRGQGAPGAAAADRELRPRPARRAPWGSPWPGPACA